MNKPRKMTSRQRLISVMEGEIPDRVPVTAFIDPVFLTNYLDRPVDDLCAEVTAFCRSCGFDSMIRIYCAEENEWEADEWRMTTSVFRQNETEKHTRTIETPGGKLTQVTLTSEISPGLHQSHRIEHLVKTPHDLDLMERYKVIRPPVKTGPLVRAMNTIGEDGIVVTYGGGAAHTGAALNLRGLEQLSMDALDDPAFYERLLRWAIEYETGLLDTLETIKPDLCQIGGLLAQGNFLGPRFYRDHVLPYDKEYIKEMHRRGLKSVYHNCGFSRELLEFYTELGTDAFETFPPPPVGDGDIELVKRILGPGTVLIGNIDQTHLLREASPEEVYEVTRDTVLKGKSGGKFILMTADEVFPDTPIENLRAMARAGIEHGVY